MSQDKHTQGTDLPSEHSDASTGSLRGVRGSQAGDELNRPKLVQALSSYVGNTLSHQAASDFMELVDNYAERLVTERAIEELRRHRNYSLDIDESEDYQLGFEDALDQVAAANARRVKELSATLTGKAE